VIKEEAVQLLDEKFKGDKLRYLLQSLLATVVVCVLLLVLDTVTNAAVIAALGASSFIAFTMPHANVSKFRYLIGGYLMGILAGVLCRAAMNALHLSNQGATAAYVLFGGVAVGVAIFLMVITNTEHLFAASLALGLVLNGFDLRVVLCIMLGIVALAVIKLLLKPILKNLL
jgi:CBS-domain-containing membrane protein